MGDGGCVGQGEGKVRRLMRKQGWEGEKNKDKSYTKLVLSGRGVLLEGLQNLDGLLRSVGSKRLVELLDARGKLTFGGHGDSSR